MPYITASIIVQLLTVVIPRFEALKKEGQSGTAKLTQYTRYLTIGLAILQSTGLIALARQPGQLFRGCQNDIIYTDIGIFGIVVMVITMTAGTGVIMWLGELITDRGIGNGMSLLIFTSIAAGFPTSLWQIKLQRGWALFMVVIAVGLVHRGPRRLRRAGPAPHPGAVRQADDRPADVRRLVDLHPAQGQPGRRHPGHLRVVAALPAGARGQPDRPQQPARLGHLGADLPGPGRPPALHALYFVLIVFFTYFYVAITFNPTEVADNMKKYGGFIPGIRAGRPTAEYLDYVLSRITAAGALYLGVHRAHPAASRSALFNANQNFPFGGTAILIIVGVGLETVKQIESQLQQRNYEGFLR